jgi:tRNA pseudouridine13 synthase
MIRIGNFHYVKDELRLGRLRGNRFDIALRNIQVGNNTNNNCPTSTECTKADTTTDILNRAVKDLQENGFINYFGVQRFGKYHNTHITGLAILRGDFQDAIDTIVCPPMLSDTSDGTVTDSIICEDDMDPSPMISKTSKRDDDIRKVQLQWKNRFKNVSVNESTKEERAKIEQNVAKQALSVMNHYMQSEIAILQSLVRDPLNYEKAFGCIHKTMRMMFIHAVQSLLWNQCATYRMNTYGLQAVVGDLVLAPAATTENNDRNSNEPYNINDNQDTEGCPEVKVLNEADVIERRYKLEDIVLPLIGVKTRNPENSVGTYMQSLLTERYNIRIEMIEQMEKQRDFHCSGDYRKVICRPTDIRYEIIEYIDEFQPLLQTDFMKLNGIDVPHRNSNYSVSLNNITGNANIASVTDSATPATSMQEGENTVKDIITPSLKHKLIGMAISFTLPSSAYATICLRELMKRPTSSEYQRELQMGYSSNDNNELVV